MFFYPQNKISTNIENALEGFWELFKKAKSDYMEAIEILQKIFNHYYSGSNENVKEILIHLVVLVAMISHEPCYYLGVSLAYKQHILLYSRALKLLNDYLQMIDVVLDEIDKMKRGKYLGTPKF